MVQAMMASLSGTHPLNLMGVPPQIPEYLGTAYDFSLVGLSISNVAITTINQSVGCSDPVWSNPGLSGGDVFAGDAVGIKAVADVQVAYNHYMSLPSAATLPGDLIGRVFTPGVYSSDAAVTCSVGMTLDGSGYRADELFVFQVSGALSFGAASSMTLINCNANQVVWVAAGAISVGAASNIVGTFIGAAAVSLGSTVRLFGRLLAFAGVTSTNTNIITTEQS